MAQRHVVLPISNLADAQREIERLARLVEAVSGSFPGGPPLGPAGGVLSGSYPDPGFAVDMATQLELNAAIAAIPPVDLTPYRTSAAEDVINNAETAARIAADTAEATTRANADALLAPLASPTFTGDPKAPTPASSDNDTSIATTAFVKTESASNSTADRNRANHTGSQLAATISDFDSAARAQVEAELVAGTGMTIVPSGSGSTRQLTLASSGGGGGGGVNGSEVVLYQEEILVDTPNFTIAIPTGYRDIRIVVRGRGINTDVDYTRPRARFNGDSTAGNYDWARGNFTDGGFNSEHDGGGGGAINTAVDFGLLPGASAGTPTQVRGAAELRVFNYLDASNYKSMVYETSAPAVGLYFRMSGAGQWKNTAAINSLFVFFSNGSGAATSLKAGGSITVYGISDTTSAGAANYRKWSPFRPPTSPNALDVEFAPSSTISAWPAGWSPGAAGDFPNPLFPVAEPGKFSNWDGAGGWKGRVAACPAAGTDFSLAAHLAAYGSNGNFNLIAIGLSANTTIGNGGASVLFFLGYHGSYGGYGIGVETSSTLYNWSSNHIIQSGVVVWIRRVGTDYYFGWSSDGLRGPEGGSTTLPFTPAYMTVGGYSTHGDDSTHEIRFVRHLSGAGMGARQLWGGIL